MRALKITTFATLFAAIGTGGISAESDRLQHQSHIHTTKSKHDAQPSQAGQGAFAAIAEIVEMLRNDPGTDWASVNIAALREHLVDMNNLTLNASAVEVVEGRSVTFKITGDGKTLRAIQTMVPAHSSALNRATGWTVSARINGDGAEMRLTAPNDVSLQEIRSLGFFGIMATGAHHQAHHLQLARTGTHGD